MSTIITDINKLNKEAKFKVLSLKAEGGGTVENCGLFDKIRVNEWNTERVFYWSAGGYYLELEIYNRCNIYRAGTTSWDYRCDKLIIYKLINDKYINISDNIVQNTSKITENEFELWIQDLEPGQYKFQGRGVEPFRLDSEWYIELSPYHLLKKDSEIYGINEDEKFVLIDESNLIKNDFIQYHISLNKITNINIDNYKILKLEV